MTKLKSEPLDLSTLDPIAAANRGAEVELKHPVTKKGLGIFVGILGQDSEVFRDAIREREDNARQKRLAAQNFNLTTPETSSAELEEAATDLLILCTTHWRTETVTPGEGDAKPTIESADTIYFGGEHLKFTVANARTLYTRLLWMRSDVDKAIGNISLFIKP